MECTGRFNSAADCQAHLAQGARKVLISAPAGDDCPTIVYGVNQHSIEDWHDVLSVGSCTTNCLAPVLAVLDEQFGVSSGYMTTVHAYTGDQNLVDGSHKDIRRARAAALSMVPTKTGAASAIGRVLPGLAGRLHGSAIRVPVPNVSLVDLSVNVHEPVLADVVNAALGEAVAGTLTGVLAVSDEPLVSIDFTHRTESAIVDLLQTAVVNEHLVHVAAWYDNEWGFACRMLDLARWIRSR